MRQFGVIVCLDNGEEGPSPLLEPILFDPAATWLAAALKLAKKLGPGKTVVTILPDTAERYFSTPLFQE